MTVLREEGVGLETQPWKGHVGHVTTEAGDAARAQGCCGPSSRGRQGGPSPSWEGAALRHVALTPARRTVRRSVPLL